MADPEQAGQVQDAALDAAIEGWNQFAPVPNVGWPAPYAEGAISPWIGPVLMALPMALALLDSSGRMIAGNEAMMATAGSDWRPGLKPDAIAIAEDAAQMAKAVAEVVAGQPGRVLRLALKNRPDDPQDVRILPIPPGLGVSGVIAMRDIRDQVRLEAQVAAASRMQAVGQLAGGVAHDFNNLLTAVLALAEQLLERRSPTDPDFDALVQIRRNGERGAALVRQLLAFARQQPQRQQLLDPGQLVDGLRPLIAQLLGPAIELDIGYRPLEFALRADPGQIEQVIVNLAVNARDAMSGNGQLRITVSDVRGGDVAALGHDIMPAIDHIAIDITDTGTGIPRAIRGRIFEPFFTTKPQGQGTGLGLSTVYGIVKQSGGYIFAKPGPANRGTTFSVYLPARPKPKVIERAPPVQVNRDGIAGIRVLLVEDEPAVRTVFARGLERKGMLVVTAEDATSALALLREEWPVDVLVSDVMMPGIDGVELAMEAGRLRPGIGIVLMSGYAELPRHRAADAKGMRFLAKPFALEELVSAIGGAQPVPAANSGD
ncbi:response regulator [Sandarakinorhabdus sp.]|uniref:response regulator n=1 Tax=Sandarakinorhabdus sp. TaxID=1916663 RepID=UPI00286E7130|nr:response regulator [Sandarakinorhabdus sp.]